MDESELKAISGTLMRMVTPSMSPKDLIKAARKEHPKASKKDIVRAAFFATIANSDQEAGKSVSLQAFAISERTGGTE